MFKFLFVAAVPSSHVVCMPIHARTASIVSGIVTDSCFLDAGIFNALFSTYLRLKVEVTEIKCNTMGDECCSFLIEPTEEEFIPPMEVQ